MERTPQFVINRLHRESGTDTAHPDANLLTAFAERSLDERERGIVMEHLALCVGCRDVVALALPVAEAEVLPGAADIYKHKIGWLRFPALRWGALAAALLTVTLIALQHDPHRPTPIVATHAVPAAPIPNVTATAESSQSQLQAPSTKPLHQQLVRKDARHPRTDASAEILAENDLPRLAPGTSEPNIVKAKDPVALQPEAEAHVPSPNLPLQTSPAMMLRASPRWAVTSEGRLQRTFDAGKTWEAVLPTPTSGQSGSPVFRAIFALGPDVWAGGVSGVLYHSVDGGNRWARVEVSAQGVASVKDIIAVEFSDRQHGTISTADSVKWSTSDSGQSWRKEP